MRKLSALLAVGFLLAACNGGGDKAGPEKASRVAQQARLSKVVIEPAAPTVVSGVRALVLFHQEPRKTVPLMCQWFINGNRVDEIDKTVLPTERYRRGNRIHCRVRPRTGGKWLKSAVVTVVNAPPRFRPKPVTPFDIPGEFFHQVFADDPDGDPVTYRLVSPLDRGIDLDPDTGIIRWNIEALPEEPKIPRESDGPPLEEGDSAVPIARRRGDSEEPPEMEMDSYVFRMVIEADDRHGGTTLYTIIVDLKRGESGVPVD